MLQSVHVDEIPSKRVQFTIQVGQTIISLCIQQLIKLLLHIQQACPKIIEFSLQASLFPQYHFMANSQNQYNLFFGKTVLILQLSEVIEFLSQMWLNNPMLMHWITSQTAERHEC